MLGDCARRCLPFVLALGASSAGAQGLADLDFDYSDLEADAPIEVEEKAEALTYGDPSGGEITVYGQFNPVYQSFDDGQETTSGIVDNGNWNSRIGVMATEPLSFGTLRFRVETAFALRNSALVSQEFTPQVLRWNRTWLRWFEVAFDSDYGTISLGQGSSASDGTAGLDDSFTFVAGATDSSDGFGAFQFRDAGGNLTGVTVGSVNAVLNGARRFRVRYDSPAMQGFVVSGSYGVNILSTADENDYYDIALRWTGDLGDVAVRSAIGYQWIDNPNGANVRRIAGSVSALHGPTGLNLAFSAGEVIDGESYVWSRAGWRADLLPVGKTSLSVDYYRGRDFRTDGARTGHYGVYAVQSFDDASLDLYAGWRSFSYSDLTGTEYQDATGVLVGLRWAF
jgi:Gram-negative porin